MSQLLATGRIGAVAGVDNSPRVFTTLSARFGSQLGSQDEIGSVGITNPSRLVVLQRCDGGVRVGRLSPVVSRPGKPATGPPTGRARQSGSIASIADCPGCQGHIRAGQRSRGSARDSSSPCFHTSANPSSAANSAISDFGDFRFKRNRLNLETVQSGFGRRSNSISSPA